MTRYLLLIFGFLFAVMPSMIAGVINGLSFLGTVMCLIAAAWIVEADIVYGGDSDG